MTIELPELRKKKRDMGGEWRDGEGGVKGGWRSGRSLATKGCGGEGGRGVDGQQLVCLSLMNGRCCCDFDVSGSCFLSVHYTLLSHLSTLSHVFGAL